MDTKLKSNKPKNKWNTLVLILVLLTIPANWLYSSYWQTRSRAVDEQVNIFETDDYFLNLNKISYSIYADLMARTTASQEELLSNLVQIQGVIDEGIYWDYFEQENDWIDYSELSQTDLQEFTEEYVKRILEDNLSWFEEIRHQDFQNLQYAVYHHESGSVVSRGSENLQSLATGNITLDDVWSFQHVVVLNYDEQGNLSVSSPHSEADFLVRGNPVWISGDDFLNWRPIKNTTFVFALPWTLSHNDSISVFQGEHLASVFIGLMRWNILMATGIVSAIAIFIPLRTMKEHPWFKKILDWPLEGVAIILLVVLSIIFGAMPHVANSINIRNAAANITGWFGPFPNNFYVRLYWRILNIGVWVAIFSILTLAILYLKNFIPNKKELYSANLIAETDLKDPLTMKLISLTGIHFLLISVMCLTGAYGIAIALAYSICVFLLLRKYLAKTQGHYLRILEIANYISEQNIETTIAVDEDLGLFNSMKDKLTQLQFDLKDIVEDDSKNQRFKEELVNYLSDELQDPITAMMMYIELLQDESLDESLKQDYLMRLEKQSNHLKIRIEDLFVISKIGTGQYELNLQPVDIVNLLQESITEVGEKIEETTVMLRTQFPEELVQVPLDVECMHQVFVNLLINMVKHGLPRTRAYVDVVERAETVQVVFRNISVDEIDQSVDELMSQHEKSKSGLKMIKSYVELHGGTFEIKLDGDLFKVQITLNKHKEGESINVE